MSSERVRLAAAPARLPPKLTRLVTCRFRVRQFESVVPERAVQPRRRTVHVRCRRHQEPLPRSLRRAPRDWSRRRNRCDRLCVHSGADLAQGEPSVAENRPSQNLTLGPVCPHPQLFPPLITGSILLCIGLSLMSSGITNWAGGSGCESGGLCPNASAPHAAPWGSPRLVGLGFSVWVSIVSVQPARVCPDQARPAD